MATHHWCSTIIWWVLLMSVLCCAAVLGESAASISDQPRGGYFYSVLSLHCGVTGDPTPVIRWLRDGSPVVTSSENPAARFTEPSPGNLEVLGFSAGDEGEYVCMASNRHGSVTSDPATVKLSEIDNLFRKSPTNENGVEGEEARFHCSPPWGRPHPALRWYKDNQRILSPNQVIPDHLNDHDVLITGTMSVSQVASEDELESVLTVRSLSPADEGEFWCEAENKAGVKVSLRARLSVFAKPTIANASSSYTVTEGSLLDLPCDVTGSLPVTVRWLRGRALEVIDMMDDRFMISPQGHAIIIKDVTSEDSGVFYCEATNNWGTTRSLRTVAVQTKPVFYEKPRDASVRTSEQVVFRCNADGLPRPEIMWTKKLSQESELPVMMYTEQTYMGGRLSIGGDGTLTLSRVHQEDSGVYQCRATNSVGYTVAAATLRVSDSGSPPPTITLPPVDQTVFEGETVTFTCESQGQGSMSRPSVSWERNGQMIRAGGRFTIDTAGTLSITNAGMSDAGEYSCTVVSESGSATTKAKLTVKGHQRMAPQRGLPLPPSQPFVSNRESNEISLIWGSTNQGRVNYTVYYFNHLDWGVKGGWKKASNCSNTRLDYCTVSGLYSGTFYKFIVRSRNSVGISEPSSLAQAATNGAQAVGGRPYKPEILKGNLNFFLVLNFDGGEGTTFNSFNVSWEIIDYSKAVGRFIEGFRVRITHLDSASRLKRRDLAGVIETGDVALVSRRDVTGGGEDRVDTVYGMRTRFHVVRYLKPDTRYAVSVTPFYHMQEGRSTLPQDITTKESAPSRPPTNLRAVRETGKIILTWTPVIPEAANGQIIAHKIYVRSDNGKVALNLTAQYLTMERYEIPNMRDDFAYKVAVSALTSAGEGPPSRWKHVTPLAAGAGPPGSESGGDTGGNGDAEGSVFVQAIIGVVSTVVCCLLTILVVCVCIRRRGGRKTALTDNENEVSVPLHTDGSPSLYLTYQTSPGASDTPQPTPSSAATATTAATDSQRGQTLGHMSNESYPMSSNTLVTNGHLTVTSSLHSENSHGDSSGECRDRSAPGQPGAGGGMTRNGSDAVLKTYYDRTGTASSGPYATTYIYSPGINAGAPPIGHLQGSDTAVPRGSESSSTTDTSNRHGSTSNNSGGDNSSSLQPLLTTSNSSCGSGQPPPTGPPPGPPSANGHQATIEQRLIGVQSVGVASDMSSRPGGDLSHRWAGPSEALPIVARFADIAPPPPQHAPQQEIQVLQCAKCGHCSDSNSSSGPGYSDGSSVRSRANEPSQSNTHQHEAYSQHGNSHQESHQHHHHHHHHHNLPSQSQPAANQHQANLAHHPIASLQHRNASQHDNGHTPLPSLSCSNRPAMTLPLGFAQEFSAPASTADAPGPAPFKARPSLPSSLIQGNRVLSSSSAACRGGGVVSHHNVHSGSRNFQSQVCNNNNITNKNNINSFIATGPHGTQPNGRLPYQRGNSLAPGEGPPSRGAVSNVWPDGQKPPVARRSSEGGAGLMITDSVPLTHPPNEHRGRTMSAAVPDHDGGPSQFYNPPAQSCDCAQCREEESAGFTEYDEPWSHPWSAQGTHDRRQHGWDLDDDQRIDSGNDPEPSTWRDGCPEGCQCEQATGVFVPSGDRPDVVPVAWRAGDRRGDSGVASSEALTARGIEEQGLLIQADSLLGPNSHNHPVAYNDCHDQARQRRRTRERRERRPTSPYGGYSTDSSFVFVAPRKPYPKSERKKQMVAKKSKQELAPQPEQEEATLLA